MYVVSINILRWVVCGASVVCFWVGGDNVMGQGGGPHPCATNRTIMGRLLRLRLYFILIYI